MPINSLNYIKIDFSKIRYSVNFSFFSTVICWFFLRLVSVQKNFVTYPPKSTNYIQFPTIPETAFDVSVPNNTSIRNRAYLEKKFTFHSGSKTY